MITDTRCQQGLGCFWEEVQHGGPADLRCKTALNFLIFNAMHIETDLDQLHIERLTQLQAQLQRPLPEILAAAIDMFYEQQGLSAAATSSAIDETGWEALQQLVRACEVDTGISDLAHQHDHYLYGTPKRE